MSSGFNISTFRSRGLTYGGARPSLFEVYLTPPAKLGITSGSADKFRFTCRGATLPPAVVGTVEASYFGRRVKFAGDRTFPDWTVSVLNDEDFLVRSMFEKWSNALNRLESNVRDEAIASEADYMADMTVIQYGKDQTILRSYDVIGAFPTAIDPIELSWDAQNQIETFNVTFAYQYWLPGNEQYNEFGDLARMPVST